MPDPLRQTISATQTPALFGVSPYLTRWMLLRHFIHGDDIAGPEHNRMDWGKKMQPLVLAQAADDLHLEVRPNVGDQYVRRGLLGCTRDADIICPDRGPGALETKVVFDYGVWMSEWNGGKTVPKQNEIQLQQQMLVGDGFETHYEWGVIAALVCGDMYYFERKPISDLWIKIKEEAQRFFADVASKVEGDPFGEPIEMPLLQKVFPPKIGTVADFTKHPNADGLFDAVRMMAWHGQERLGHEKAEKKLKSQLKALVGDAEESMFLGGAKLRQKQINRAGYSVKPSSYTTIEAWVPDEVIEPPVRDTILSAG